MKRDWKDLVAWIILTLACGGLVIPFAFMDRLTFLVIFLIYLPFTSGIVWLTVYRHKAWFGLWFLVFWGWLTYISSHVDLDRIIDRLNNAM